MYFHSVINRMQVCCLATKNLGTSRISYAKRGFNYNRLQHIFTFPGKFCRIEARVAQAIVYEPGGMCALCCFLVVGRGRLKCTTRVLN